MRIGLVACGMAGVGLFTYLLFDSDLPKVFATVAQAHWGILALLAFHNLPLLLDAFSCRALFPPRRRPTAWMLFWTRWIGESLNILLPAAQVGGDIVRARLLMKRGVPGSIAVAAQLGDLTTTVAAQFLFTIAGLITLASIAPGSASKAAMITTIVIGCAALVGFYVVQRWGIFRLLHKVAERMAHSHAWREVGKNAAAMQREVDGMYSRWRGVLKSLCWSCASWGCGIVEMYLMLWALGLPAHWTHAFVLEAAGQGARAMLFMIPAGLGVQEGTYVLVGGAIGITAEGAMAISLLRRARELSFGIPALLAWPFVEGRGWKKSAEKRGGTATAIE
jgi:putative membrane protein